MSEQGGDPRHEPSREEIWEQRAQVFRPAWFGRLFGARLGLGDTFWIGHFGLQLLVVPLGLVFYSIALVVMPDRPEAVFGPFSIFQVLLSLAVFQAVIRVAWRVRGTGIWPWIAMLFSAANVYVAYYYASKFAEM
ncbi:MAG: hypothetical protein CSA70_03480 [Rhodobacterales bacterium]|nr:MAG: hypothetical protein CSA70_03480 [Rhodobacterales bacterium]